VKRGFDHGCADVGSGEGVDARAEAVPLLEELVEEDDEEGGDDELRSQTSAPRCLWCRRDP
jgi:hypothetical protein